MLESVGSKASQETYPLRGWTLGQTVALVEVSPTVVRWMKPSADMPANTRLPSVGATAMALTEPVPAVMALAWLQLPALLVVRQRKTPPVHNRLELLGSIMKGAMKRKLPLASLM